MFGFVRKFFHHLPDFFFMGLAPDGRIDVAETVAIRCVAGDFAAGVVFGQ